MTESRGSAPIELILYFAWLVALVATLGSLYFSEIRSFVPCTLCWYQRILMYPMVILLGIAAWNRDRGVVKYALPLMVLGIGISGYHVLDQKIPTFGFAGACSSGVPCNVAYVNYFGFITIPVLALTSFVLVSLLLLATLRWGR